MTEKKTIINEQGYIVDKCVDFENNKPKFFKVEDNMRVVDYFKNSGNLVKPKWNGSVWVEGATEEEIKTHEEENKVTKEPTEQEKLNAQLLQANAQQQLINASLVKQIAELQKGGN